MMMDLVLFFGTFMLLEQRLLLKARLKRHIGTEPLGPRSASPAQMLAEGCVDTLGWYVFYGLETWALIET